MNVTGAYYNVTSEDPERLDAFYRNVVGLEPMPQMGEHALKLGENVAFAIDGHSATKGPAKEPHRTLLSLFVDDIAAEESRLEARGVTFIRKQGREFWGGVISTFVDPDGNYCQIIEYRPEEASAPDPSPQETSAASA